LIEILIALDVGRETLLEFGIMAISGEVLS